MNRKPINLDAATDRSLRRIRRDHADPRHEIAGVMAEARKARVAGQIASAQSLERIAEHMIARLPAELRW
jgi:hypothetical protein